MEQSEVETLIEELETRVDRLRALYEQYFIGIERLEPGVPRKDVERRFYVLRRTQIRNTALRFRFQNVLLRYNTYQTYWIRICRQIEEGTYKRDIRKANARFAPSANPPAPEEIAAEDMEEVHDTAPPSTYELDLDFDADEDFSFPEGSPPRPAAPSTRPVVHTKLRSSSAPPVARPPLAALPKAHALQAPATPTERQMPFELPIVGGAEQAKKDLLGLPRKAPPTPPTLGRAPPLPPRPATVLPAPPARPVSPPPASPRSPPSSRPRVPVAADAQAGIRRKSRQAMPKVEAPRPAQASPPRPTPKATELSDERLRQIYKEYVDAKRAHKESTASLTFDNLAKSLRESSNKLKEKHVGRSVDFEITVKNGKTILRPIVK